MEVDHIGYAVKNIEKAIPYFEILGFTFEEIFTDTDRNIYICFGNNGETRIELIAPIKGDSKEKKDSPVDIVLKNNGAMPYHICYRTDDIEEAVKELNSKHFIVSSPPKEAIAFNQKKVAFLYNAKIGLIEVVEN